MKKLYKSNTDRVLTGVLGGIATYVGIDSVVLRLIFIALLVTTGFLPFGLIYILAYFIIPDNRGHHTVSEQ